MIPVFTVNGFVVCFSALQEDRTARDYFMKDCGWTSRQFRDIEHFAFFTAQVSLWRDGIELASEYLGACSYERESDFFTRYANDYFSDMVRECFATTNQPLPDNLYSELNKLLHRYKG